MPDSEEDRSAARVASPALGLGERLRSARKARALSASQVAEALHLEEETVLALEDERFEVMGAAVFVRGHLKRYAELVGLPPDAVLDAYRTAVPQSTAPPSLARPRAEPETVRVGAWAWWLVAAAVLLAVFLALGRRSGESAPEPAPAVPALAPFEAARPSPADAPGTGPPPPADPAPAPAMEPAVPAP